MNVESEAHQTILTAIASRLGNAVPAELHPIIEAIAASLREGHRFKNRSVSVTVPVVDGQTLVVSVHTAKTCVKPLADSSMPGLDARKLQLVNEAIDENIDEELSVSTLSSVAGLSRSYFSQAFRKSVGRTPHEHVVRMRIERAMALMVQRDAPLSEIALATGFCDQAHFAKTFRRAAGMTPTQWRKRYRPSYPQLS